MITSASRGILATATLVFAAALSLPALAAKVDGPKVHWNFNMSGQPRAVSAGPEEMSRLVNEATGGAFMIQMHYGSVLGPEKEVLDAISLGAYEATAAIMSYTPGRLPATEALGLPFLPTPTIRHVRAMREAYLTHPVVLADIARWNATLIMPMPLSGNEFMGKGIPVKTLADFKGMRVRALAGAADAMKLLGAVPHNFPTSEIYGAMERGLLDASASQINSFAAFKTHEVSKWYTTNLSLSSAPAFVLAGTKAYNALPSQYRKLIADSVTPSLDYWVANMQEEDQKALKLFEQRGLTAVTFADDALDQLRKQVKPIWDSWVEDVTKKGYPGQELLGFLLASAAKAM